MISFLAVGAGGFIGALLRYLISELPLPKFGFPVLTLAINIIGSLVIGIIVGIAVKTNLLSSNMMLFLKVGICGGFTTFSTFALETNQLFTSGKPVAAIAYIVLSVLLCVIATYAGQALTKV